MPKHQERCSGWGGGRYGILLNILTQLIFVKYERGYYMAQDVKNYLYIWKNLQSIFIAYTSAILV